MHFKYDSIRLPAPDNPSVRLAQLKLGGPSKINESGPACTEFLDRLHLVIISTHVLGFFPDFGKPCSDQRIKIPFQSSAFLINPPIITPALRI